VTGASHPARLRSRRELSLVLLLGLAGAGLVLLATRQGWARVTSAAPRPLPAGSATVTGQELVPVADALAVAAIASLAAVLATRRLARRITGLVLAGLGAGIAVAVSSGISAADVLAAAAGSAGPGSGAEAGAGPGSVTSGSTPGGSGVPLTGFAGHVMLAALGWRQAAVAGAVAVIAAGILATWRAGRLPVMSSRYERSASAAGLASAGVATGPAEAAAGPPGAAAAGAASGPGPQPPPAEAASMWESLSRGEDPTGQAGTGR
jgi:hypothetical protein